MGEQKFWYYYLSWHGVCRRDPKCVAQGVMWKCSRKGFCGGLGDQLKGLTTAFHFAIARRRLFTVEWERGSVKMLQLFRPVPALNLVPVKVEGCAVGKFIDRGAKPAWDRFMKIHSVSEQCTILQTNAAPTQLEAFERCVSPIMMASPREHHAGCALNLMFGPLSIAR